MSGRVVALNAGSSSIKFALFDAGSEPRLRLRGQVEGIGATPRFSAREGGGAPLEAAPAIPPGAGDHAGLLAWLLETVVAPQAGACAAIGHRVVHGGTDHDRPVIVDDIVLAGLERLAPLARSHQPHNLAAIRAARSVWPGVPQIACFDTAFHRTLPEAEQLFAIPAALAGEGVRRYGFHGLSYEAVAALLPTHLGPAAEGRVVVAHLGNGASLCGMVGRRSRATTMGFTPLDGLVMGRRPGRLDPGVVLWLQAEKGLGAAEVSRFLNRECGLYGLSGLSADMRDLLADGSPAARRAIEVFVGRLVSEIGATAASIGGLDALVFTGGIGENAAPIRAMAAERLAWLGVALDADANARHATDIGAPGSRVRLLVLPADEEGTIARHALALVARDC